MNSSIASNTSTLRRTLPFALVIGALAVVSARAHADDEIPAVTISAPAAKTVGRDYATLAPIEETTVTARVAYDPVTLTTNSGVALLNDAVLEAARKACWSANSPNEYDGSCVQTAVRSAQQQVTAAIAHARSSANG